MALLGFVTSPFPLPPEVFVPSIKTLTVLVSSFLLATAVLLA